jgi:hypothetical protein
MRFRPDQEKPSTCQKKKEKKERKAIFYLISTAIYAGWVTNLLLFRNTTVDAFSTFYVVSCSHQTRRNIGDGAETRVLTLLLGARGEYPHSLWLYL